MASYLIQSPHTPEECLKALDHVLAMGYLTHFHWACLAGDHTGYLIFEAANKSEALLVVPSFVRDKARVIELTKFSEEMVKSFHNKK